MGFQEKCIVVFSFVVVPALYVFHFGYKEFEERMLKPRRFMCMLLACVTLCGYVYYTLRY